MTDELSLTKGELVISKQKISKIELNSEQIKNVTESRKMVPNHT